MVFLNIFKNHLTFFNLFKAIFKVKISSILNTLKMVKPINYCFFYIYHLSYSILQNCSTTLTLIDLSA